MRLNRWFVMTLPCRREKDQQKEGMGSSSPASPVSTAVIRALTARERTAAFRLICTELLDEADPTVPSDAVAAADFVALNQDLDRFCAGDPAIHFVAAVAGESLVGVAAAAVSFLARPGVWEAGWQAVREYQRRQGIGSALLRHLEAYARAHQGSLMLLSSGNPEYHQRAGYRIVAEGDGDLVMAKRLT
ncbi:hypothetical protein CCP1ISM_2180001 [Azospirillaceae bacterium]